MKIYLIIRQKEGMMDRMMEGMMEGMTEGQGKSSIAIFAAKDVSSFCNAKATYTFQKKIINVFSYLNLEILTSC